VIIRQHAEVVEPVLPEVRSSERGAQGEVVVDHVPAAEKVYNKTPGEDVTPEEPAERRVEAGPSTVVADTTVKDSLTTADQPVADRVEHGDDERVVFEVKRSS